MRVSERSALARKSKLSIMRDSRLNSSRLDSMTSRYFGADLDLVSATSASPRRLKIGVRSSCARSAENCESCLKDVSNR